MSYSPPCRNHRSPWTLRELDFVEKHYRQDMTAVEIAENLGRSPASVRSAAGTLGCSRRNGPAWTEAEKDILRTHYPKGNAAAWALLPGRTQGMVSWMANRLGVVSARGWSWEEECILAAHYPQEGTAVSKYLPGRTTDAVKIMACELGIKFLGGGENRQKMWSEEELALLRKYAHLPLCELAVKFPGRTYRSVGKARERLYRQKARMNRMTASGNKSKAGR